LFISQVRKLRNQFGGLVGLIGWWVWFGLVWFGWSIPWLFNERYETVEEHRMR
jgi:hypothetical protein